MKDNALIYEYAVVRYVPHVEREEFINVGLLMMCKRHKWLRCAISIDHERIKAFDNGTDFELLHKQLKMFENSSTALVECTVEERFRWLSAVKSSSLQTSRPHPGLIDADTSENPGNQLEATFDRLFADLVL